MSNQFDVLRSFAGKVDILVANNAVPGNATGVALNLHMTPSVIAKQVQVKPAYFMKRTLTIKKETQVTIRQQYPGPIHMAIDGMIANCNLLLTLFY